jgi:hypothetical protein
LFERVERIEQKLDKQFTEVQEHFVEQRKYREFAYDKLDKRIDGLDQRMTDGFSRLERKFDQFIDTPSRPTSATRRPARPSKRRR